MRNEVPAIRILPMSDRVAGFRGMSIDQVQASCFLRGLPKSGGRYRYRSTGLNAPPGTIVLFQFKAKIVASAVFIRDEKFARKKGVPKREHAGVLHFEPDSFRTFDPLDTAAMRKIWPALHALGHVKHALNPMRYSLFNGRLKNVKSPL